MKMTLQWALSGAEAVLGRAAGWWRAHKVERLVAQLTKVPEWMRDLPCPVLSARLEKRWPGYGAMIPTVGVLLCGAALALALAASYGLFEMASRSHDSAAHRTNNGVEISCQDRRPEVMRAGQDTYLVRCNNG